MASDHDELAAVDKRCREMSCGNLVGPMASIKENVAGFVRRIDFEPGHDCMDHHGDEVGRRCHGRGGMKLRFLLIAEEGATQFLMYASDWLPGSLDSIGSTRPSMPKFGVMAADLGHHWTRPVYEGEWEHDNCEYLHGASCFYDGSGLNAGPVLDRFLRYGLDAVWEDLEDYHRTCGQSAREVALSDRTRKEPGTSLQDAPAPATEVHDGR